MRRMKSRVLAAIMAAGMIFTAQGMTALAGTTGIGAAKTAQSTQGPGDVSKDVDNVVVNDENTDTGTNTGDTNTVQPDPGKNTEQTAADTPLQVNYSAYFRNQGWSNTTADNQALAAPADSWVTSMRANLINIPSGAQIGNSL